MLLSTQNKQLARSYYESLPGNDVNRKYYEGLKYQSPNSLLGKLLNALLYQDSKVKTLESFYPYHKTIKATVIERQADVNNVFFSSALETVVAWGLLFNMARRGYVLPVLREYGKYAQTHRIFRHYLYTLAGPLLLNYALYLDKYYPHIETLWTIHANRLNAKLLEDPLYTYYPADSTEVQRNINPPRF